MESNKMGKLKPFDLEKALKGEKVVTRDGREVTEIHHFTGATGTFPVVGVVEGDLQSFTLQGSNWTRSQTQNDLFMVPKERVVWINMWEIDYSKAGLEVGVHLSEEQAKCVANQVPKLKFIKIAYPITIEGEQGMSKQKGKVWYYLSSGSGKWERVKSVSDTTIEEWIERFKRHGVPVKQGGKNNAETK